eukprot:9485609-Pyramimonas_sp.AAC.1
MEVEQRLHHAGDVITLQAISQHTSTSEAVSYAHSDIVICQNTKHVAVCARNLCHQCVVQLATGTFNTANTWIE